MKEMLQMVDKSKVDEVKQMLEYTQKGTAKATVGNYMVVLRNDPLVRESMKYNKLTGRIDIVKKLWWNEEVCKLDDDGRTYFYYFFECYYKLTISAKSNEEIKSFLTRQKDTYRNPYDKYEEDRKRQCIFAGSTNTRQFIPFDRTGARRFLPIAIDSSKAEKHILDDEKEARSYFDQLWAEAMEIYWSTENKSSLLKFSKEMEQEISEYRKQFTQEDTMAGMIQGWLDTYKGSHVCSVQIWKEAFDHFDREPKKFETNEICSIMDTQIAGWKRAGVHRFSKEGYGRQRSWIREGAEEEGGNEPDKDGFTKLTKAEQLELPFDLPDREKG